MDRRQSGRKGETIACRMLEEKGYVLAARNYRAERAEIDLIMKDKETTVFIEVKARSSARYGLGREAVTAEKQRRILRAAQAYLAANGAFEEPSRFDVVEVDLNTCETFHIENAFGL